MSDMSTVNSYTVRDLNRQPAKILAAVRKFGSVEVRTRSGEVFTIAPKAERRKKSFSKGFQDLWARQRELGLVPPAEEENERINRIIAGEE
jgi:antitoxin (DNA-binding transcriptional repressor) of toxin-antitoxin stability system